jgi:putative Mg2+ transporter-C (MgtC) family protein
MDGVVADVVKLLVAMALGGLIGLEREFRDKAAGFRTVMFICMGSTLFTIISIRFGSGSDPARIAAQIVTGVGFLGAGAILRDSGRVLGLTTAAITWLAAAIGMGVGAGQYILAAAGTGLVLLVLWLFPRLEAWIDNLREAASYEVACDQSPETHAAVERLFTGSGLHVAKSRFAKSGGQLLMTWAVRGSPKAQRELAERLLASAEVKEFRYLSRGKQ